MKNCLKKIAGVLVGVTAVTVGVASNAVASPTVADIWTAVDVSGMQDNAIPIYVGIIGFVLVVSAFRIGKKLSSRVGSVG